VPLKIEMGNVKIILTSVFLKTLIDFTKERMVNVNDQCDNQKG